MNTPVFFTVLTLLCVSCMQMDSDSGAGSDIKTSPGIGQNAPAPASRAYFLAAEQQLAEKQYIFAATQLDKGIVAFRIETGKMSGAQAMRANHSIDALTKLRKTLRHGEAVDPAVLHGAIVLALETEKFPSPTPQRPSPDIMVPVSGN